MKEQEVLWQTINTHTINKKAWMNEVPPPSDLSPVNSVPNVKKIIQTRNNIRFLPMACKNKVFFFF